jgi:predicted RNA-binding protein with PUA-like domain
MSSAVALAVGLTAMVQFMATEPRSSSLAASYSAAKAPDEAPKEEAITARAMSDLVAFMIKILKVKVKLKKWKKTCLGHLLRLSLQPHHCLQGMCHPAKIEKTQ